MIIMAEQLDLFTEDRSYYLDTINGLMYSIHGLNGRLKNGHTDKDIYESLVFKIDCVNETVEEYLQNVHFESMSWNVSGTTTEIIDRAIDQFSRLLFSNGDVRYQVKEVDLMLGSARFWISDELLKIKYDCRPKKEAVYE